MKKDEESKESVKKDVEAIAREKETDSSILAGLMEFKRWKAGKSVTEKEFSAAALEFLRAKAG